MKESAQKRVRSTVSPKKHGGRRADDPIPKPSPPEGDPVRLRVAAAVEGALSKKAFDLDVLDVRGLTTIADYFIICSGNTERQTLAIADGVQDRLSQLDRTRARLIEGTTPGRWILLDFGDFVMHVFTDECRRFYGLERLWGDAPDVTEEFSPEAAAPEKAPAKRNAGKK